MFDALFVAFLALLIIDSARAQVSAPDCLNSTGYEWSYNSLGQNPCLIGAYLAAVCNNGAFTILPLEPQQAYTGPNGPDDGDLCKCNTVVYNLISACDGCQGEQWFSYTSWKQNCTTVATPGTFPEAIPAVTRVPHWAFLDPNVNGSDYWNELLSQIAGNSPEVTGSAANVPSSTTSQSTITVTAGSSSPASSSSSSSKSSSNGGAIAGGVIGGVVGVALIVGLVARSTIRRRRRHAPSADYIGGQGSDMGHGVVPYTLIVGRPKLYDPSDPSTYPTPPPTSMRVQPTNSSKQHLGTSSDLHPNRNVYHGLPEI